MIRLGVWVFAVAVGWWLGVQLVTHPQRRRLWFTAEQAAALDAWDRERMPMDGQLSARDYWIRRHINSQFDDERARAELNYIILRDVGATKRLGSARKLIDSGEYEAADCVLHSAFIEHQAERRFLYLSAGHPMGRVIYTRRLEND